MIFPIVLCSQVIYVNRFLPSSRRQAVSEIKVESFYKFLAILIWLASEKII